MSLWELYGEAAKTAVGFFWKAGWAFVLGYWVSAMIQAFVPKGRLTPYMGKAGLKSVSLATVFAAASSSCSFAALAAARALVLKGAHFMAAVAFMFASTNLVIELGILITAVMYVSIVITALAMHYLFVAIGITPDSSRRVQNVAQFSLDYTFLLNVVFVCLAAGLVWLHKRRLSRSADRHGSRDGRRNRTKTDNCIVVYRAIARRPGCVLVERLMKQSGMTRSKGTKGRDTLSVPDPRVMTT